MTMIDILVSCALMMLVLRQIRGRKLTIFSLIWPILLVGWAVIEYMTGFPLHNNGWILIIGCITLGLILGVACGSIYTEPPDICACRRLGCRFLAGRDERTSCFWLICRTRWGGTDLSIFSRLLHSHRRMGQRPYHDGSLRGYEPHLCTSVEAGACTPGSACCRIMMLHLAHLTLLFRSSGSLVKPRHRCIVFILL